MFRRSIFAALVVGVALLALAAPALAGGWAVVTLDALPKAVRAGEALRVGFVVRQHGKTPTNMDLDGRPLKPVLTARKQSDAPSAQADTPLVFVSMRTSIRAKGEEVVRAEARQEGAVGHYVVDLTFPSNGVWAWQIHVPTYYVQDSPTDSSAAVFAPLTVLPAAAPAPAPQPAPEPAAPAFLGLSPAALRWAGAALLLVAAGVALAAQRGTFRRRGVAESR